MPNPQVNPKDAALRFAFFSALNFTKPSMTNKLIKISSLVINTNFALIKYYINIKNTSEQIYE